MKKNIFDISNKTILVTGASSGIGKEIAYQLDKQNVNIVLTGRDPMKLKETIDNIEEYNTLENI